MQAPQLPLIPRTINLAGRALAGLGIRPGSLDPDDLLADASRETKLEDFGDSGFREALERLSRSLEEDAALSPLGRFIARGEILTSLRNRLQLVDWHARHPEIGQAPVRAPIVIAGQGRTGTTILHELLALDPANRVPLTWECDAPFPPPERASYEADPRIAEIQAKLDQSESLIPDFKRMHRMGAHLPQECVRITALEMKSLIFAASWRVTGYTQWLVEEAPMTSAYDTHRQMLQLLQWRCPAERWVLKSPGHLWCLEDVVAAYPDVRLIFPHRDPLRITSSISSLEVVLRKMASDDIDHPAIADEWSKLNALGYDRAVDFREKGVLPDDRIVDLHFRSFIKDPIAEVRRIYDQFGLPLSSEIEQRMRDYVAANPSDRDGKHVHHFAETGIDPAEERARVKRYQDYFEVPTED
jgi:hypothetical protein